MHWLVKMARTFITWRVLKEAVIYGPPIYAPRKPKCWLRLNAGGGSMVWDKDQKTIFLAADGGISKIDPVSGKTRYDQHQRRNDVERGCRAPVHVRACMEKDQRNFLYRQHAWVNWDSYKPDYEKYLPYIGNNYEFSEMLSELLGELNVSHSGSSYGSAHQMEMRLHHWARSMTKAIEAMV
jgi:tricorn protease